MEYTMIDSSELKVSKIGLGAWQFGTEGWRFGADFTEEEALAAVDKALEVGINLLDTAEVCGDGRSEEIVIIPGRSPKRIEIVDGGITELHTIECVSVFDEQHRFNPQVNEEDKLFIEGTMVVEAISQSADDSLLTDDIKQNLELAGRRIKVDEYYQSSPPWLFFGGDFVKGPDVITGISTGHQVARGIDAYLNEDQER